MSCPLGLLILMSDGVQVSLLRIVGYIILLLIYDLLLIILLIVHINNTLSMPRDGIDIMYFIYLIADSMYVAPGCNWCSDAIVAPWVQLYPCMGYDNIVFLLLISH